MYILKCSILNKKAKNKAMKKTIKLEKLINDIDKLNLNKKSRVYNYLVSIVNDGERKLKPVYSTGGSWKYSSLIDDSEILIFWLTTLKLSYKVYNESPRGGKTGCVIEITTIIKN